MSWSRPSSAACAAPPLPTALLRAQGPVLANPPEDLSSTRALGSPAIRWRTGRRVVPRLFRRRSLARGENAGSSAAPSRGVPAGASAALGGGGRSAPAVSGETLCTRMVGWCLTFFRPIRGHKRECCLSLANRLVRPGQTSLGVPRCGWLRDTAGNPRGFAALRTAGCCRTLVWWDRCRGGREVRSPRLRGSLPFLALCQVCRFTPLMVPSWTLLRSTGLSAGARRWRQGRAFLTP